MVDERILNWMREKVNKSGFTSAADIAKDFLDQNSIEDTLSPEFSNTLDSAFSLAREIHGFEGEFCKK